MRRLRRVLKRKEPTVDYHPSAQAEKLEKRVAKLEDMLPEREQRKNYIKALIEARAH